MMPRTWISSAAAAAMTLAGCAAPSGPRPGPATTPTVPGVPGTSLPPRQRPPDPCFNKEYRFTCQVPEGYLITEENEGTGTIMVLAERARTASLTPAGLTVKAYPLGSWTLERYVDRRVADPLQQAGGVESVEKGETFLGGQAGIEVRAQRYYESGLFKSRYFVFAQGSSIFILEQSAPAETFDRSADLIKTFMGSWLFQP